MDLSLTEQQHRWQKIARDFAQYEVAPIAREMDEKGAMPLALVQGMAELGILGATLSKQLGGSEMDSLSLALVYEELGRACSSVRGFLTVHSSLVSQCINAWANDEQKSKWLPLLTSGKNIGCYCLTEPEAGSDAASIQTRATKVAGGFLLNGEKIWITNANIADVAIVFTKYDTGEDLKPHQKITAFLVETKTQGFDRKPMPGRELGHRASDHAHITFQDCFVPEENVLGSIGQGFKVAMSALDHGRLGVAAGAVGVHQACLDASVDFVRKRKQFGQRIGDFGMVQSAIAEMHASLEASRQLVYKAAWEKDSSSSPSLAISTAKYFAVEAALKAASEAVLIHGGRGYSNEYPVERYYRDIKGMQIYEGTAYIQKFVIARAVIGKP
ncbi:MAG TPA: acyl-CoA dehydrogenase family protein [Candidatus Kapabacteria bacterium]|nr:acyl-CoA dehydrogenase family protein [Candidatus Kapabacteria bacterium]